MRIYWKLEQIPELASLSPKARKKVWLSCFFRSLRHWRNWLYQLPVGLCGAMIFPIYSIIFQFAKHPSVLWFFMVIGTLLISLFMVGLWTALVFNLFTEVVVRPLLRNYLQEEGSHTDVK
jgi:hypothetical protein